MRRAGGLIATASQAMHPSAAFDAPARSASAEGSRGLRSALHDRRACAMLADDKP